MTITLAHSDALTTAGFAIIENEGPAIKCAINPLETWSAPDWDSLVFYATEYELC